MAKPTIIFDFDGTIADSLDEVIRIMNKHSKRYGYEHISEERKQHLREENSQSILRDFKISKLKLFFLILRVKADLNRRIKHIHPVYGIKSALHDLKKQGYSLGIVSSNTKKTVNLFLELHDLELFDFVVTKTVFSKSKLLTTVLKRLNVTPKDVYYVGDETRDVEAARGAGMKIISVTWGINSREILETYKPDFIIDKPHQLAEVVQ